jgi:preprotein translocase subunit YajC
MRWRFYPAKAAPERGKPTIAPQPRFVAFAGFIAIVRATLRGLFCALAPLEGSMFLVTPAYAQAATPGGADLVMQLAPFGIILVIMYFLILRPQQKRAKQQQELVKNVRRGDIIITTGGLIGKVTKSVDDAEVEVEIAPNVKVRLLRQMISDVRVKGEPVKEQA